MGQDVFPFCTNLDCIFLFINILYRKSNNALQNFKQGVKNGTGGIPIQYQQNYKLRGVVQYAPVTVNWVYINNTSTTKAKNEKFRHKTEAKTLQI